MVRELVRFRHWLAVVFAPAYDIQSEHGIKQVKMIDFVIVVFLLGGDGVLREEFLEELEEVGAVQHSSTAPMHRYRPRASGRS